MDSHGCPSTATLAVSNSTSASYPPASPQPVRASAYRSCAFAATVLNFPRRSASCMAFSATARRAPASARRGSASDSASAPNVVSSPMLPMNCRITPSPPARAIVPDRTGTSPATIRSRVVLPAPFGPTSATFAPSPTRNDTSANSTRPSGRVCSTPATSTYPMGQRFSAVTRRTR